MAGHTIVAIPAASAAPAEGNGLGLSWLTAVLKSRSEKVFVTHSDINFLFPIFIHVTEYHEIRAIGIDDITLIGGRQTLA